MVAYRDDEGACPGPPARRDHQLAPFVAPEWWFLPDGRPIELGLVLYGGEALDGTALDDLWVYTAVGHDAPGELRPVDDCPWVLLSDAATGGSGVAGGLLHQDGDGFRLVGGREQAAGWLDARLGSPEAKGTETPLAVWIGRDGASDGVVVRGYTKGGLVVLSPFGPAGQDTASDPASTLRMLDGTATHELAHVSLSRRVFFDDPAGGPSTEWFNEAAPVVLSLQRVPGYDPHALYDGLARRVSAWTSTGAGRPEIRDLTRSLDLSEENLRTRLWFARGYLVGPYLLAQNLALRDPVGATGAWNALRDDILAQRRNQRPVSQVELAGWLEEPGTPTLGFVATRVAGGLPGEPLLALHVLDHPTSGDLLAEVVQAQGSLTAAGGTPFAVRRGAVRRRVRERRRWDGAVRAPAVPRLRRRGRGRRHRWPRPHDRDRGVDVHPARRHRHQRRVVRAARRAAAAAGGDRVVRAAGRHEPAGAVPKAAQQPPPCPRCPTHARAGGPPVLPPAS